jgi:BCD family chlorophyll transporter-like MFS transporter
MNSGRSFGWFEIFRVGCVQAALGAIVVLTTSTLNRVMVVELALPAALPGVLVALHYFIQITRPRFGHGSDQGGRRTPWIIGGRAVRGLGALLAAAATALMSVSTLAGVALATASFLMIGAGVGAAGTSLLVLLAARTEPQRRAPAATVTWVMMIASFAVTAGSAGAMLDPFSFTRLIVVTGCVSAVAMTITLLAVWRLETPDEPARDGFAGNEPEPGAAQFMAALREVLGEGHTRLFMLFVFTSMLAYSAQDLVLEPFAGAVFGLTPGQSTQLGGLQHSGVLAGMLLVAAIGALLGRDRPGVLRSCMFVGCLASAALLASLALAGFSGPPWPLYGNVFALGVANGAFAVAAIGSMMGLVSEGREGHDGMRMGVFGASQAVAFGLGGVVGTASIDLSRWLTGSVSEAYAIVFTAQAVLFATAALLAMRVHAPSYDGTPDRDQAHREPGKDIDAGTTFNARLSVARAANES